MIVDFSETRTIIGIVKRIFLFYETGKRRSDRESSRKTCSRSGRRDRLEDTRTPIGCQKQRIFQSRFVPGVGRPSRIISVNRCFGYLSSSRVVNDVWQTETDRPRLQAEIYPTGFGSPGDWGRNHGFRLVCRSYPRQDRVEPNACENQNDKLEDREESGERADAETELEKAIGDRIRR